MSGIGSFFKAIWHGLQHIFGKDNLDNLAHAAEKVMETAAGSIVMTILQELNATTMTNSEKRDAAFSRIKSAFISNGHTVGDSMINLLIELGVQAIKGQLAVAASGSLAASDAALGAAPVAVAQGDGDSGDAPDATKATSA